jgi:hypothetical protein
MSYRTPCVVELHVRTLEPTVLDTFRPVEHLPSDVELLVVVPGHEDANEKDSRGRLL